MRARKIQTRLARDKGYDSQTLLLQTTRCYRQNQRSYRRRINDIKNMYAVINRYCPHSWSNYIYSCIMERIDRIGAEE